MKEIKGRLTGDGIGRFAEDGSLTPLLVIVSILGELSVRVGAELESSAQSSIGEIFVDPRAWHRVSVVVN
jgi:hypothetical protein